MSAPVIRPGAQVRLHYALSHADGTEIDASLGGDPLHFVVGDGTFAPGLEQVLLGMPAGRCERILLGPGEAFGARDESNVHAMSRSDFGDLELSEGSLVSFALPNGDEIAGVVKTLAGEAVDVDFNHPLAGLPLQFYVEIIEVIAPE